MRARRRMATTLALTVAGALLAAAPAAAKQVDSGWSWTNYGPELMSVACSDPLSCVAVGQGGAVLRSPNTDDVPLRWSFPELQRDPDPLFADEPVDLVAVTCTDTSCLAVSNTPTPRPGFGSWVYRSTDGGIGWTAEQQLPEVGGRKTASAAAIACTPAPPDAGGHDCYAAGVDGGIWRSTDDGQTWKGVPLPAAAGATASFDKIACAGGDACVAAGGDTTPSSVLIEGAKVTVLKTPVGIDKRFAGLACDRPGRCVGTGGVGKYALLDVDDARWGAVRDFRVNKPKGLVVGAMSCPLEDVCVGLTDSGLALRTTDLGAPSQNWGRRPAPDTLDALACVTSSACVAVGNAASWFASFDVGSGFGRVNQVGKFDLAQCTATFSPTCVGAGKSQVGVSRTGGELWTLPLDDRSALNANTVNCTAPSTCQILGQTDNLFTEDFDVWRARFPPVQSAAGSEDQTCVTATLCVAVGEGTAYTTFDAGVTPWVENPGPPVRPSAGIACLPGRTDPVTCLVPAKDLILIGTMTQDAAGLPHWRW
ncbi:MAG TPA: sialidase family protein, partial [Capillimicrobium sp.]